MLESLIFRKLYFWSNDLLKSNIKVHLIDILGNVHGDGYGDTKTILLDKKKQT